MLDTNVPMITDLQDTEVSTEPAESKAARQSDVVARQQRLAEQLVEQALAQGPDLTGANGLIALLTKRVLETALEAETVEHLGYEAHQIAGRDGGNSRNGKRSKTVVTGIGPVEVEVPRDRNASFEPVIVKEASAQARLDRSDRAVAFSERPYQCGDLGSPCGSLRCLGGQGPGLADHRRRDHGDG